MYGDGLVHKISALWAPGPEFESPDTVKKEKEEEKKTGCGGMCL